MDNKVTATVFQLNESFVIQFDMNKKSYQYDLDSRHNYTWAVEEFSASFGVPVSSILVSLSE